MTKRLKFIIFLLLILSGVKPSWAVQECVMNVGWMERPSYQYADKRNKPQGFDIDYVKELSKDLSCEIVFRRMPWFRQDKEMLAGRIDILLGALSTGQEDNQIIVSDSYRQDPIGYYVLTKNFDTVLDKNITEILNEGAKLGLITHDTRSEEIHKLMGKPFYNNRIFLIESAQALLRNLNLNMIDGVMLHASEIDYLRMVNNPLVKNIKLVPHLSFMKKAHLISGTKSPLGAEFMTRVNTSIQRLKDNGVTNKLLMKHVPSHFKIKNQ